MNFYQWLSQAQFLLQNTAFKIVHDCLINSR